MREQIALLLLWCARHVDGCDCSWVSPHTCGGHGDGSGCWIECCSRPIAPSLPPSPLPPPLPPLHPIRYIDFVGKDGKLFANGKHFKFKGVNWWGCEGFPWHAPYGLDVHSVDWYMEWLTTHRFNAVRFFFQIQGVNQNQIVPEHIHGWGHTDYNHVKHAPYLAGLRYVQMIKRLIQEMGKHGILVLLANHRLAPKACPGCKGSGFWYSDDVPLSDVKRAWTTLAQALCTEWNLIGVDVQNEPFKSSWGFDNPLTDWNLGAEDLGNHILSQCPRWLIMVEGVADQPGSHGPKYQTFWGENCESSGVRTSDPWPDPSHRSRIMYRQCVTFPSDSARCPFSSGSFERPI